jgi:aryl-alcohol dehydrogenase-like predicted oxidoreductase
MLRRKENRDRIRLRREDELKASKGSEPRKVSLAWAIARSMTMSRSWTANRLNMSNAANVSQQVRRFEAGFKRQTDSRIKEWLKTVKNCASSLF